MLSLCMSITYSMEDSIVPFISNCGSLCKKMITEFLDFQSENRIPTIF